MYFTLSRPLAGSRFRATRCMLVVVLGVAVSLVRPVLVGAGPGRHWARCAAAGRHLAAGCLAHAAPRRAAFRSGATTGARWPGSWFLAGRSMPASALRGINSPWGRGSALWLRLIWRGGYPAARVVFSGGSGDVRESPPEAHAVQHFASVLGLDVARMSFDDASRNTAENAAFVAALVGVPLQGRWLLVSVEAFHVPRRARPVSQGRAQSRRLSGRVSDGWLARSKPLVLALVLDVAVRDSAVVDLATKEWVGLLAARVLGQSGRPVSRSTCGSNRTPPSPAHSRQQRDPVVKSVD